MSRVENTCSSTECNSENVFARRTLKIKDREASDGWVQLVIYLLVLQGPLQGARAKGSPFPLV